MIMEKRFFMVLGFFVLMVSYFIFHIYHGERGLYAKETLEKRIAVLTDELTSLQTKRQGLERKIKNLGGGKGMVDADLLSEHMRDLGYVRSDEIMLLE